MKRALFVETAVDSPLREKQLDDLKQAQIAWQDMDGDGHPELLIAGEGFCRALTLSDTGDLKIIDQYNARRSEDTLQSPLPGTIALTSSPEQLLLYAPDDQSIQVLQRDDQEVYRYHRSHKVGAIDLLGTAQVRLGKMQKPTFLFFGTDRFWSMPMGNDTLWHLENLIAYETDLKDIAYSEITLGDLNSDNRQDILAIDGRKNILEILSMEAPDSWKSVLHFPVFETNLHYQGRQGAPLEPRELLVADLTNDGRQDLVLIVHDRILLYPQGEIEISQNHEN